MGTTDPAAPTRRLWMLWLSVGAGVAAGVGVGVGLLATTAPVYEASTSVLVESLGPEVNMHTEAELVHSTRTATDAFARIGGEPDGRLVAVQPVPGTSILLITFEAGTASGAQAGANAFAEAYLAARSEAAQAPVAEEIASTQQRLDDVRRQLGETEALIEELDPDTPELEAAEATRNALAAQVTSLTARLTDLRSTTVDPGRIVAQAALPPAAVRPDRTRYLGLAAAAGALVGALAHLARIRWSRRVRHSGDLRRHGIGLLAEVGRLGRAGAHQAFNRLRNEVEAALEPSDRTILVTGAAPGPASLLVSASLAAAFARAGQDVILVGASVPHLDEVARPPSPSRWGDVQAPAPTDEDAAHPITLAAIFDLADIPGLTDVLAGRTSLPSAVQRAARNPRLRVVTPGGTASAAGLLQSDGAKSALRQLASRTRYVIVDAPSTATSADAQSLACAADVALLVVELAHTRRAYVADGITQLARVGTRLLGAVVVPRLTRADLMPARGRAGATAGAPDHSVPTDAWIGTRHQRSEPMDSRGDMDALDGPTTKLDALNHTPPTRVPAAPAARPSSGPATAGRTSTPPTTAQ